MILCCVLSTSSIDGGGAFGVELCFAGGLWIAGFATGATGGGAFIFATSDSTLATSTMAFAALFKGRTVATLAGAELSAFPPDATRSLGAAFIGATPGWYISTPALGDDDGRFVGGAFIGASLAGAVPARTLSL